MEIHARDRQVDTARISPSMSNHAWSAQRHSSNAENAVANLKSNCEFVGVLIKPTLDFSVRGEIQL